MGVKEDMANFFGSTDRYCRD